MKNKRGAEIIKIYTPNKLFQAVLIFTSIIMTLIHFPAMLYAGEAFPPILFLFLIPLDAFLIWHTIITCTQTRLIIYSDGIEIQRGGAHFFSSWENMQAFERRGTGKSSRYGIALYEAVEPEVTGTIEKFLYGASSDFMSLNDLVNLPASQVGLSSKIEIDIPKLAQMEFGQDVYSFAPHLFATETVKVKREQAS